MENASRRLAQSKSGHVFLLLGAATAFFDLLTTPILPLGIALLAESASHQVGANHICPISATHQATEKPIHRCAVHTAAWCVGYAGFWAEKWLISTLLTGEDVLSDGINNALGRTSLGGLGFLDEVCAAHGIPTGMVQAAATVCLLAAAGFCLWKAICAHRSRIPEGASAACLWVVAAYPLLWYVCTLNHSIQHAFFTWRALAVTICALLMLYQIRTQTPKTV